MTECRDGLTEMYDKIMATAKTFETADRFIEDNYGLSMTESAWRNHGDIYENIDMWLLSMLVQYYNLKYYRGLPIVRESKLWVSDLGRGRLFDAEKTHAGFKALYVENAAQHVFRHVLSCLTPQFEYAVGSSLYFDVFNSPPFQSTSTEQERIRDCIANARVCLLLITNPTLFFDGKDSIAFFRDINRGRAGTVKLKFEDKQLCLDFKEILLKHTVFIPQAFRLEIDPLPSSKVIKKGRMVTL